MSKFLKYTLPIGIFILAIVSFIGLIAFGKSQEPEKKEEIRKAILVDVIEAEERNVNFTITSQGSVQPRTETTLVAEVQGKISWVSPDFIAGGFFNKGEVLLEIDPSDYEAALKRAEANLASQQARLSDERARSEQALRDWENLGRTGEPSDLVLRKPQVADAIANVSAAEADVDKATRDLERTRISVPYDGLVKAKQVDIGQYVAPGTQLGVTFSIDVAEIRLPLSPDDVAYLDLPSAIEAEEQAFPLATLSAVQAGELRTWEARIVRTEGVVDEMSRVIYAVAQLVDPYRVLGQSDQDELKIGTFVRAEIEGRAAGTVVMLPRYVLQENDTVLVANDDSKLEVRTVTVIRAEPDTVYLSGGITSGERIVTTTLDVPVDGLQLAISGEEQPVSEPSVDAEEAMATAEDSE